ncbi:rubrerythrin family protein [candidate division KSB3 bacterium]|uniref:Rubrerythrin family protein n=1 Tax=candidate division KSB3 bacterium TaxID=2044937 RepID=A0A2G6E743_9BACT|nr:MAG: rubrerythrin family protein [candidate division KSB3 bacterium]PIE30291.1 MAG: rubrerythrin family protein [candidate division KSB3 bacterium]
MTAFKGSKTAENLMKAFAGESQARGRYTYYAEQAVEEGFEQIGEIFRETAYNEEMHARLYFDQLVKNLGKDTVIINGADYPVALAGTKENLTAAAEGEHAEWTEIYPAFAKDAEEEGFPAIAKTFTRIADVEKKHEMRYNKLLENVTSNEVFKKKRKMFWKCRRCGFILESAVAPPKCPVCAHPQAYFELFVENY